MVVCLDNLSTLSVRWKITVLSNGKMMLYTFSLVNGKTGNNAFLPTLATGLPVCFYIHTIVCNSYETNSRCSLQVWMHFLFHLDFKAHTCAPSSFKGRQFSQMKSSYEWRHLLQLFCRLSTWVRRTGQWNCVACLQRPDPPPSLNPHNQFKQKLIIQF